MHDAGRSGAVSGQCVPSKQNRSVFVLNILINLAAMGEHLGCSGVAHGIPATRKSFHCVKGDRHEKWATRDTVITYKGKMREQKERVEVGFWKVKGEVDISVIVGWAYSELHLTSRGWLSGENEAAGSGPTGQVLCQYWPKLGGSAEKTGPRRGLELPLSPSQ